MLDTLRTMILDFQESQPFTGVPRRLEVSTVPGKATVCIGVRRAGKSTFMFQLMKRLQEQGIDRKSILYVNFFDDRLHRLEAGNLGLVTEAYYSIYPEKKGTETVYCFFDEIQAAPGWEAFVDRVMRTEKCEVYLTGSSAHLLSREIATQMRGRALSWEIFPFSFLELLDYKGVDAGLPLSTKRRLMVQKAFEDYWRNGGFPEVQGLDARLRVEVHQEYFNAILFRDVVERYDTSHPRAVKDLAHFLLDNVASLYSVNRLHGYLRALGHKISKAEVGEIVEWFEDAYFLFSVRLYSTSIRRSKVNPKKIYCIDHAFVRSVSPGVLLNSGHLLENIVLMHLKRSSADVHYYKTHTGKEVDFLVVMEGEKRLVQVSETLSQEQTRKREVLALVEAMEELGLRHGTMVTRSEQESIETGPGPVNVVPVWKFLLEGV
ncbi:MAG: ATP-binding protein [Deltaproteobacteria bacterium]|nr:ATP-binding protein [Deltaproteobacteria bacterium]